MNINVDIMFVSLSFQNNCKEKEVSVGLKVVFRICPEWNFFSEDNQWNSDILKMN